MAISKTLPAGIAPLTAPRTLERDGEMPPAGKREQGKIPEAFASRYTSEPLPQAPFHFVAGSILTRLDFGEDFLRELDEPIQPFEGGLQDHPLWESPWSADKKAFLLEVLRVR